MIGVGFLHVFLEVEEGSFRCVLAFHGTEVSCGLCVKVSMSRVHHQSVAFLVLRA